MDTIKTTTLEAVKLAYEGFGVSKTRIDGLEQKFVTVPDEFKITGLTARKVTIAKVERVVPEFEVTVGTGAKAIKQTIPVGQLFAQYAGDTTKASQITKKGSEYIDRFLVSNNKRVNSFCEGMSEAEFIVYMMDKKVKAEPAKNFPVYSGFVTNADGTSKLTFHASEAEAIAAIVPKSYRPVNIA